MKTRFCVSFLALFLSVVAMAEFAVVLPQNPSTQESFAAKELQEHLAKIVGASVSIVNEGQESKNDSLIYLGKTKKAEAKGKKMTQPEEWLIQSLDGKTLILTGYDVKGTLNSVYTFLDRFGQVRWFDEKNCQIPENRNFKLPQTTLSGRPSFRMRWIYDSLDQLPSTQVFKMRNRSISDGKAPEMGNYPLLGAPSPHHTFHNYADTFPVKKPEMFAMGVDGSRPQDLSGQLCMTNPDTRKYTLQALRKFIEADRKKAAEKGVPAPVIYDISANDNPHCCVCPACKAIAEREGGTYSAPQLEFINYLAREIRKEYPEIYIRTFAYLFSYQPPKTLKAEPNVMIHLAMLGSEFGGNGKRNTMRVLTHSDNKEAMALITGWAACCDNLAIWDYWKLFGNDHSFIAAPYVNLEAIGQAIPVYQKNHVHDLFVELESPEEISFFGLKRYLGMRLMEDATRNPKHEIQEFMTGMYGPGAAAMQEYLDFLTAEQDKVDYTLGSVSPHLRTYMNAAFFQRAFALLNQAMDAAKAAGDVRCQNNIERELIPVYAGLIRRYHQMSEAEQAKLDYPKAISRYEILLRKSIDYYFPKQGDRLNLNARTNARLSRNLFILREQGKTLPVPQELAGKKVIVLPYYKFNQKYPKLVVAPDSLYGKAVTLGADVPSKTKNGKTGFGIWDADRKVQLCSLDLKTESVPQDEKFHLVRIGRARFRNSTPYFWATNSWMIQCTLEELYEPTATAEQNTYDVYVSIRFTGKPYVPSSALPEQIAVDALFLVQ